MVIIKPDGLQRGLFGKIVQRFEDRKIKILAVRSVEADHETLAKHYDEHKNQSFFESLLDYMQSGPIVLLVLEGENVITIVRKMIGVTNSAEANPGTIRGDFSINKQQNLIHASASSSAALKEIQLWFPDLKTLNSMLNCS